MVEAASVSAHLGRPPGTDRAPSNEYRESEQRAALVREYLIGRYNLKPQNPGALPLSDTPPERPERKTGTEFRWSF